MSDYLPKGDTQMVVWGTTFNAYLGPNATALGVQAADAANVSTKLAALSDAQNAWATAKAAAEAANATKELAQKEFTAAVRSVVRRIQANPAVTDAQRQSLGITVHDTIHTAPAVPTQRPNLRIDALTGQEHRIVFYGDTAVRYGKPAGVAGIEIYRFVGAEPPTTDAGWEFVAYDTASPYLAVYDAADVGKKVWYRARWRNAAGECGPWSNILAAIVTGG